MKPKHTLNDMARIMDEAKNEILRLRSVNTDMLEALESIKKTLSAISPHEMSPQPREELGELYNLVIVAIKRAGGE